MHDKDFEESTPYVEGDVGWYVSRIADVNQADRVAAAIDALSQNSDHETKTMTEHAATPNTMTQKAHSCLSVGPTLGAVFFTPRLPTGPPIAQPQPGRIPDKGQRRASE